MKIAVTADGRQMENIVPDSFESSPFVLIVETDDSSYEVFENPENPMGDGVAMVREIIRQDCEAVICGSLEKPSFEALVEAQVTRYVGTGHCASDVLNLMHAYQLDLIRVPNGEVWNPDHHHHDPSNCSDHEH